jgi:GT2 family glycosyltransferase
VPRAQAVDGVLIGAHRKVCDAIPFDEQTFTGFHHYDIDFSYRAFLAGFSCGIVLDLDIFHFGVKGDGYRTPEWLEAAIRFTRSTS